MKDKHVRSPLISMSYSARILLRSIDIDVPNVADLGKIPLGRPMIITKDHDY